MDFNSALTELGSGNLMRRDSWPTGVYIAEDTYPADYDSNPSLQNETAYFYRGLPGGAELGPGRYYTQYTASYADIAASDWSVFTPT